MKSYSLSPTDENIAKSLVDDSVDRNKLLFQFINLLDLLDDCYTIAINGNWGSGKTFFVKQAKLIIDFYNQQTILPDSINTDLKNFSMQQDSLKCSGNYISAYYDAWENDTEDDPILSIVKSIVTDECIDFSMVAKRSFSEIIVSLANVLSGRDVDKFVEAMKGKNPFSDYKSQRSLHDLMKDFFDALIIERGNRLVIFIDELDRCKPTYAVKLLERIKHYFIDPRVTFVFSINAQELQSTIKQYYGPEFNSGRYLDKFFDFRLVLPSVTYGLCNKYFNRLGLEENHYYSNRVCRQTIKYLGLEMREVEKFARNFKIVFSKDNQLQPAFPDEKATHFAVCFVAPILIALDMCDAIRYDEFIHGKSASIMVEILSSSYINISRYPYLLAEDEAFAPPAQVQAQTQSTIKIVNLSKRIEEIYDALFLSDASAPLRYKPIQIGEMEFSSRTRNELLERVSMLSGFNSFDFR